MAEWFAKSEEERKKKSCDVCATLANPEAYEAGARVFVGGIFDCENCEVAKAILIPRNEIILELYSALPQNFDGMTGLRIINSQDVINTLKILDINEELWCDYYNRLMYYHNCYVDAVAARISKKEENKGIN